jgi:hypothetical protein
MGSIIALPSLLLKAGRRRSDPRAGSAASERALAAWRNRRERETRLSARDVQYRCSMVHNESMLGLWIVRDASAQALLAKVEDELYVLAFTSAPRATRVRSVFGAEGSPFLIVAANARDVIAEARNAGARGFIVDYDADRASFSSAHPLPAADVLVAAAR